MRYKIEVKHWLHGKLESITFIKEGLQALDLVAVLNDTRGVYQVKCQSIK